jgi:ATP-dependent RNA helicase DDX10/DBP4
MSWFDTNIDLPQEGDNVAGPTVAHGSDDEGYRSPDFDLPSFDEAMSDDEPSSKRPKRIHNTEDTLAHEEELALRMLRGQ